MADVSSEHAKKLYDFYISMIRENKIIGEYQVSKEKDGKPTKFMKATGDPYSWRVIFDNEIVFDIDTRSLWYEPVVEGFELMTGKEWEICAFIADRFVKKLKVPKLLAYSGGRGIHIHVFFDPKYLMLGKVPEVRYGLAKYLLDVTIPEMKEPVKDRVFDLTILSAKRHLIREYGSGKSSGYYKTLIEKVPKDLKELEGKLKFPENIELWTPEISVDEVAKFFKPKERKEKVKRARVSGSFEYKEHEKISLEGVEIPACIKSLVEKTKETGTLSHFGRFTLVTFYHQIGTNIDEIHKLFLKMRDYDPNFTSYQIMQITSRDYYVPSCVKLKEQRICPREGFCKVKEKESKSPFEYVLLQKYEM